jgi:hypothetical protein
VQLISAVEEITPEISMLLSASVPLGRCEETSDGSETFVRRWSKATATLDCKAFKGNITMI